MLALSKQLTHWLWFVCVCVCVCVCEFVSEHSYALHNHALSVQLSLNNNLIYTAKQYDNWYDDAWMHYKTYRREAERTL